MSGFPPTTPCGRSGRWSTPPCGSCRPSSPGSIPRPALVPVGLLPTEHVCLWIARLLQPEGHAHLAVHRRGSGEVLMGLRLVASSAVGCCEGGVAMGEEWADAELGGEG